MVFLYVCSYRRVDTRLEQKLLDWFRSNTHTTCFSTGIDDQIVILKKYKNNPRFG